MSAAIAAVGSVLSGAAASKSLPELSDSNFALLRKQILPTAEERKWQEIPWRSSFWNAVVEAQRNEKPILAWTMNGHPLACT